MNRRGGKRGLLEALRQVHMRTPTRALKAAHKLGVIADDLTGANDTGVQFSKRGLSTMVVLDIDGVGVLADEADVVVIDTDSRWCDPDTAFSRVKAAAEVFGKAGISTVYKKIDSTLRGNIGAELDAVMDVFEVDVAFVVPAFPATGRVTIDGQQLLRDVPLAEAEVASDLLSPVTESHVPTLLARQTRRPVGHVSIDEVGSGSDSLLQAFQTRIRAGDQIIVVDASDQVHLRTIATTVASLETRAIVAGSAGLAGELPAVLGMTPSDGEGAITNGCHGALVIGGSASPTARAQLEFARTSMGLPAIVIDSNDILAGLDRDDTRTQGMVEQARSSLSDGRDLLIFLGPRAKHEQDSLDVQSQAHHNTEDSRRITAYLGLLARHILASCKVAGLVLTGGDTALAVCKGLGGIGITVLDEIIPGMPSGRLVGGPHAGLMIVTKAGSFGEEDAIVQAVRYIRSRSDVSGRR